LRSPLSRQRWVLHTFDEFPLHGLCQGLIRTLLGCRKFRALELRQCHQDLEHVTLYDAGGQLLVSIDHVQQDVDSAMLDVCHLTHRQLLEDGEPLRRTLQGQNQTVSSDTQPHQCTLTSLNYSNMILLDLTGIAIHCTATPQVERLSDAHVRLTIERTRVYATALKGTISCMNE